MIKLSQKKKINGRGIVMKGELPRKNNENLRLGSGGFFMSTMTDQETKRQLLLQKDKEIYVARNSGRMPGAQSFKVIDLFCGAGGMTLGFSKRMGHNFEPVWANDFNKYCTETYNYNFGGHCITGDIVDFLETKGIEIPEADLVIGGPPCQGFSLLNKKRENDSRNHLWKPYLEIVRMSNAKVFVIENVPQILGTPEYDAIVQTAEKMGFRTWSGKVCAADYGVPQVRWRALIVGSKILDPNLIFPMGKTHYNPSLKGKIQNDFFCCEYVTEPMPWKTVGDAIRKLPRPKGVSVRDIEPPLDLHFGRTPEPKSLQRYMAIPEEGMNRFDLQRRAPQLTPKCWLKKKSGGTDLFGRLWWSKPSLTIRTEFFKPEKGRYLHPSQHRPITHREAARLQSFPDDFVFVGSKIEIAKQIGNAVPPLLAIRIADCIYALLTVGLEWISSHEKNEVGLWQASRVGIQDRSCLSVP